MQDSLGDRMKAYEKVWDQRFTPNSCLVIRVDGKAFHTFTRGCDKPFDVHLTACMSYATAQTAKDMQGFKGAYTQSDEATFMLTDFDSYQTEGWFGYELNKIVSITASAYTAHFNYAYGGDKLAMFDARAFVVPHDDAPNVFVWRQQDWARNSVMMLAQDEFSHKQLQNVNVPKALDMLFEAGRPWEHLDPIFKYGSFVFKDTPGYVHAKLGYQELKEHLMPKKEEI